MALEYKYDGLRIQAHIKKDGIILFSRLLENMTPQFPDVVSNLGKAFKGREAIVEGEVVTINIETGEMRPFQEVSHRRGRKYGLDEAVDQYPVAIFLFDCMYLDGKSLLDVNYLDRRKFLKSCIDTSDRVLISMAKITEDAGDADLFFQQAIESGCEGIMAKMPDAPYRAGARGWQWIKFKRDYKAEMTDTVDLVVVGGFAGHGKRQGVYGALLMAAYNRQKDRFETVCKLGTGFSDKTLAEMKEILEPSVIEKRHARVLSNIEPDYHMTPDHVLEIAGAEITLSPVHTCAESQIRKGAGLAIRFPRYTGRYRDDRGPEDATTVKEIIGLYKSQNKKA
jgi:DNA ligase-1